MYKNLQEQDRIENGTHRNGKEMGATPVGTADKLNRMSGTEKHSCAKL